MINGKQPFLDMDVGKMFAGLNFPGFDVEGMMSTLARQAFDEAQAVLRDFTQPSAPEERFAKNAELAKQAFEKGIANARELGELVSKAHSEAFDVIAKRVTESFDEFRDQAKKTAR